MPRENIHNAPRPAGSTGPVYNAALQWVADKYLQLGVVADGGESLVGNLYGHREREIGLAMCRAIFAAGGYVGTAIRPNEMHERDSEDAVVGYLWPNAEYHKDQLSSTEALERRITSGDGVEVPADAIEVVVSGRDLRHHGRRVLEMVTEHDGPMASVWVDLDRRGVNRLIRMGRKARDAVFGRDE